MTLFRLLTHSHCIDPSGPLVGVAGVVVVVVRGTLWVIRGTLSAMRIEKYYIVS